MATEKLMESLHFDELVTRKQPMPSVELVGSTARVPLAEVLKEIALQELSGDLQVNSGRGIRTLYFDRGFIVFAQSNLKRERLGDRLIESGKLTKRELDLACSLMKGRKRLGAAIVQAGFLTEEELGREVARQAKNIVLSAFGLKNGIFSFDERACVIPMDLRLGLSVYKLLLEGVRRMTNAKLVVENLSLDRKVRICELPPFSFEETELLPVERKVWVAAENRESLRAVLNSTTEGKGQVLRAAYGLVSAGIIEYEDASGRVFTVQEETENFLLSSLDKRPDLTQATNVRQQVLLQFDSLEQVTPGELLDVDESADEEEVRRAYERRRGEWEQKQSLINNEKSLYVKVETIKKRLSLAHQAILAKRSCPAIEEAEAVDELDFEEVEIELDFDEEQPEITTPEEAEHQTHREDVDFVEAPGEAESEPEAMAVAEPAVDIASSTEMAPVGIVDEEPERASVGRAKLDSSESDELKRLLYDIKIRKAVNDAEGAISLMYEVLELVPDHAKYEMMLAESLAAHPVLNKRAERHFRRALSIEPQSADLHYRMGKYYKKFNMRSRALAEFKTALRIDPRHTKARSELVDEKKGNGGSVEKVFKKIFG
jgi:tetratricopeptide (TPR) repeat protein